ncbi:hypothetical protein [Chrysiogenes arsenatis]|uniref:hypothetical protein n=1 Tax=Chrysiogenes arsenatis TaxID=309797 RepID=UPI000410D6B7|nr:hypothetical protein [Chrysiogenes arsenatis]
MATVTFDTHSYVKRLKSVGFSEEQAEVFAEEQKKLIEDHLVTKQHLDMRLRELEYSLTIRLGGMLAASIAVVAALVKLL